MSKAREHSSILNGKQTIYNRDGLASGLTIECDNTQTEDLFQINGANGNSFIIDENANPLLTGYGESVIYNNDGNFDFLLANFFVCVPASSITITPNIGTLQVTSATIHLDNTGHHTISMPPNTHWINYEDYPTLKEIDKCVLILYTYTNGTNWFLSFAGELHPAAPF